MVEPTQAIEAQPRWSIWIDIEGFSTLWNDERAAVRALGHLMEGILQIGETIFPGDSERIWAHQFGDGFVIVSEFHEPDLERCAAIAVSLMRQVARAGFMARAAIAEGDYADVAGLWPRSIREAQERAGSSSSIGLGSGVMTLLSTMGTALIRAKKLDETCLARGSVVAIATDFADRLEHQIIPALRSGFIVLADRYIYTAFARDLVRSNDRRWIRDVFGFALVPDLVCYLRIDVETLVLRVIETKAMNYWESGMDLRLGNDLYDSFK